MREVLPIDHRNEVGGVERVSEVALQVQLVNSSQRHKWIYIYILVYLYIYIVNCSELVNSKIFQQASKARGVPEVLTDEGPLGGAPKVDVLQVEEPFHGWLVPQLVERWPEAVVIGAQEHMLTAAGQQGIGPAVGHEGRQQLLSKRMKER